jgi:LCP family protein required for cell wall assembly
VGRAEWDRPRRGMPGARPPRAHPPWGRLLGRVAVAVVSTLVVGVSGYAWAQYHNLDAGVHKSGALAGGTTSANGDTNILIMGLDSRLDENGNPLPADIYNALHAGNADDGGYNANVLMLLHVPGDGSRATSLSIPRDDYVSLPGCPDQVCKGKIKQAYGYAFDAENRKLTAQGVTDQAEREQRGRDAGRKAEIDTVRAFLGGVPIDHFVEVTLVAFFQIAQVVQPVTVCVDGDTRDSYSGANFHRGQQQIDAAQAVAFVRQRRDYAHPDLNFTDLDRERRQQAFIASLGYQLKRGGTLTDPAKLQGVIDVAKQNIAVDSGFDLLSFGVQASNLTSGDITFVTLPIDHFGKDPAGEDVNIVDVPAVQAMVRQLFGGQPPAPPPTTAKAAPPAAAPPDRTVDAVNATTRTGLAGEVEGALAGRGYPEGTAGTSTRRLSRSVIYYRAGDGAAASTLSTLLGGLPTAESGEVRADHLRVVLGSDFSLPAGLNTAGEAAPEPAPSTTDANPPNAISGGGIPCVK